MGVTIRQKLRGLTVTSRALWLLLIVLSLAPLFPLSNYVGHSHWDLIRWIPFQDFSLSRDTLKDIGGNVLWFMMLGYLLHYQLQNGSPPRRSIATITVVAVSISLSIELFQVFCHNRTPSMTDVICNGIGAGIGGYLAEKQRAAAATGLTYERIFKGESPKALS